MARESQFERDLIKSLQEEYPGAIILKNNSALIQGIPDRLILYRDRWAAFDAKRDQFAPYRVNQEYYIKVMNRMSYASFVYPENLEEFLYELQQTLRPRRATRVSVTV